MKWYIFSYKVGSFWWPIEVYTSCLVDAVIKAREFAAGATQVIYRGTHNRPAPSVVNFA